MSSQNLKSSIEKLEQLKESEGLKMTQQTQSTQQTQRTRLKIVAAIPCYNEARFIGEVVAKTKKYVDKVIVVDDGSRDGTEKIAESAGALIVNHRENKGYGEAIKSCFRAAKADGADILVTLDGDGQHDPEEIPRLLEPILCGEADLVIGSRFLKPTQETQKTGLTANCQLAMPRYRRFGISVITWLFNLGSSFKVSDAQSGFRAYGRKALEILSPGERGMGVSVEVLAKVGEKGLKVKEVPISCSYHPASSSLNPAWHGLGVTLTLLKLRFKNMLHKLIRADNA